VSPSFSGADYETGVGGPGKPTTVAAALDRLIDSFGAPDFMVKMPDGEELRLSDAIRSISSGTFFNVVTYGADNTGVADATPAIEAAVADIVALGGGTLFFPAGTYRIATQLFIPSSVNFLGAGPNASFIVFYLLGVDGAMYFGDGGPGTQSVQGLHFSVNNGVTLTRLLRVAGGSRVSFSRCFFRTKAHAALTPGNGATYVIIDDCDFTLEAGGMAIDSQLAARAGRVDVRRCRFVPQATMTGTFIIVGACVHLLGCLYDGTLATVNVTVFNPPAVGGVAYGSARCCEFIDSSTRAITCFALGTMDTATEWFAEDGNFLSMLHASSVLYSGTYSSTVGYYCKFGSRESRMKAIASSTASVSVTQTGEYGIINIRSTFVGNFSIQPDTTAPIGARLRLVVVNGDTVNRTITFGSNARGGSYVVGPNKAIGFELVRASAHNGVSAVTSWYVVGTSGFLTTGTESGYPV